MNVRKLFRMCALGDHLSGIYLQG